MPPRLDTNCAACGQSLSPARIFSRCILSVYKCGACKAKVGVTNKYQILTGALYGGLIAASISTIFPKLGLITLSLISFFLTYIFLSLTDFVLGTGEYRIKK